MADNNNKLNELIDLMIDWYVYVDNCEWKDCKTCKFSLYCEQVSACITSLIYGNEKEV